MQDSGTTLHKGTGLGEPLIAVLVYYVEPSLTINNLVAVDLDT